jgi:phage-related protein
LVYAVRFKEVVYVLHDFQKKSPKGIETGDLMSTWSSVG